MVTIPVRNNLARCPACDEPLLVTLEGTAIGKAVRASNDQGLAAPNQAKVFVDWSETDHNMDPVEVQCTHCCFCAPWSSISFSGVT